MFMLLKLVFFSVHVVHIGNGFPTKRFWVVCFLQYDLSVTSEYWWVWTVFPDQINEEFWGTSETFLIAHHQERSCHTLPLILLPNHCSFPSDLLTVDLTGAAEDTRGSLSPVCLNSYTITWTSSIYKWELKYFSEEIKDVFSESSSVVSQKPQLHVPAYFLF